MGKLWSIQDVAEYLGIPVKTLYDWRSHQYGPVGRKIGRYVRYRPEDVYRWVDSLESCDP
jgi:predicted DNA-binding transcriptional regulator AlpA